ncbi:MAG: hypothetical protein NVS2B5_19070 [Beijerinckiaceae bacterium]
MSGDVRLKREFIATCILLLLLAFLPLATRDVYWLGVLVVSAYFAILATSRGICSPASLDSSRWRRPLSR